MKKKLLSIFVLLIATSALACNVPVFRYALERWDADGFELAVLHSDQELTEEEQQAFDLLEGYSFDGDDSINLHLHSLTPSTLPDHFLAAFFEEPPVFQESAVFYLFHPRPSNLPGLIFQAPLTLANVKKLLYSELRKTISDSICSGTTIVWVLVESGDPEKDSKVWKTLQEAVVDLPPTIELPEGITLANGSVTGPLDYSRDPDNVLDSDISLKIEFQALRLSKGSEEVLMQTMRSGFELEPISEPRVYSFFGQGRCLDPLTGSEINLRNFKSIAKYLCGACSCEVKYQNPGIDVLMLCPWFKIVNGKEDPVDYSLFQKPKVIDPSSEEKETKPITLYVAFAVLFGAGVIFSIWRSRR